MVNVTAQVKLERSLWSVALQKSVLEYLAESNRLDWNTPSALAEEHGKRCIMDQMVCPTRHAMVSSVEAVCILSTSFSNGPRRLRGLSRDRRPR